MELINIIINCKTFMIDLHSKGSEGSLIDIYSFMEKASSLNYKESLFNFTALNVLKFLFNLSKIQSKEMDKAIIVKIYNHHLENKRMRKEYKNVIVEGDGPVGLYAAFELFMEGMNATLVNNRPEDYTRNRFIFFDPKWMPKLRFFLGSGFDKLSFGNKKRKRTLGRIPTKEDVLKIKNMENVLKERVKNLSNYINEKEGNQKGKSFLNLIYNTAVLDINTEDEKPLVILGAPMNRPQSFDYAHLKQILTKYEGMTIFESNENIGIPFDLIFCDFIKQIKYDSVILNKKQNKKIFKENHQKMSFKIHSMDSSLLVNFDHLTKKSFFITQNIRNRYYYIFQMIYYGMEEIKANTQIPLTRTGKVYKTTSDGKLDFRDPYKNGEFISVQIFDTETTIQIESEKPMAIVELIEEVKNEREELEEMNDEEFRKRWYEAIIDELKFNHDKEVDKKLKRIKLRGLNKRRYQEFREKSRGENLKRIEYENYKNMRKESEEIQNKQNKLLEEKIKNLKIENDKLFEKGLLNIEEEHEKMLEKYDDFIVELKERWFKAILYHVIKYKSQGKKKVTIKLSKEIKEEEQTEKGEASSSNNIETIHNEQDEHILYFDKNSLIRKTTVEKIYGKEVNVTLIKEKRDSGILVSINDENTAGKINEGKFFENKMRELVTRYELFT
ncbi:unnamed protein product [Meloidogyne enterolobii]|uniref:Uncharacterized protein n=1 Tax=Meloidogyne enterolobii TaxID=390850 RepID=A0ACB1AF84_MELEN